MNRLGQDSWVEVGRPLKGRGDYHKLEHTVPVSLPPMYVNVDLVAQNHRLAYMATRPSLVLSLQLSGFEGKIYCCPGDGAQAYKLIPVRPLFLASSAYARMTLW